MIKKIFYVGVILVMCLGLFTGCNGNKYNAVIYDNANEMLHKDFLKSNLTLGSRYFDEDKLVVADDESYPKFRTFVVRTQEDFDSKFVEFPSDVDFEKSMICIYIFTTIYPSRSWEINNIRFKDETLKIEFKMKKPTYGQKDASQPQQKCLVVKMDKIDVAVMEFVQL